MAPATSAPVVEVLVYPDGSNVPGNWGGLCLCGCGATPPISKDSVRKKGYVKGRPRWYVPGHNRRKSPTQYLEEDRGHDTPCWVWQRTKNDQGYGQISRSGRMVYAHRVFYEEVRGAISDGLHLDHLCRVRPCVNPAHLEAVTCRENVGRGNTSRGRHAVATLEWWQVRAMRRAREEADTSTRDLARAFGVRKETVNKILSGRSWKESA